MVTKITNGKPGESIRGVGHTADELSDNEMVEIVLDYLDVAENLNVEDVDIHCENGTVVLAGHVETKREHQRILELIEEDLGFGDVIDQINVDELEYRDDG
jgi:osmotically-inducible protein OsmY